ncbi:acyltransferase family protein [Hymenobacter caeli]|uniref:Peptidoglycan/LPS O-acetylase OafA/YrhL n=1 Tax=Hymenobacter caeli TaxID=2735894 RepID=A0ABX2FJI7_9BACT|nr:acyltransferase [Hymenobacter caeli]NRT17279.1 peptidoglycan/LPS O-acetylase OafA/YrhL [Hymenobacter caeli]
MANIVIEGRSLEGQRAESTVVPPKKFVEGLGFLRGVAALSVCLYHFTGGALPKLRDPSIERFFTNGWLGVDIFFVISGFIIPYSLVGKNYSIFGFFGYIKKRIIRINPPAYVGLGLVLAQWYFIDYFIAHNNKYTAGLSLPQLINNITFTIPFTHYKWIVAIFWTLAIEFQFYIFIGLLFNKIFENFNPFVFLLIFLSAAALQYLPFTSRENFFHYSSLFALGGLALCYHRGLIGIKSYAVLLAIFFIIAWVQLLPYIAIIGLVTVMFISFFKVKNRVADFFGKISYSFYLIHFLVGSTCEFFLIRIFSPDPLINKIIMLLISLIISTGCAYVFYNLVEKQFMKLANKL